MTKTTSNFERRDFLKLLGISLASVLIAPSSPLSTGKLFANLSLDPEIQFGELTLRGNQFGQVQKRTAEGGWQTIASFGEQCAITDFMVQDKWLFVTMQFQGCPFSLKTTDARTWRTVD